MTDQDHLDLTLEPDDGGRIANLTGPFDAHLRQIEVRLGIEIRNRGNRFRLVGKRADTEARACMMARSTAG